ncbi:hypothetical protein [Streptomyces bicolor]|uniref:hypothetical protein n=1 Tax=Streptomyces bicolor TaxID=66874 RepID=UPI001F24C22D|nr:hypothetical protein [Streptomyces bicolor]
MDRDDDWPDGQVVAVDTATDFAGACYAVVPRFRDDGENLWVGQMSVGDCWVYEEEEDGYSALLIDCAKPHTDQVIGTVQAPREMSHKNGSDNATKLCGNKFESIWAPGPERTVYGWIADEEDWEPGFNKVVCTVSRSDDKKTTGKIPAPGEVEAGEAEERGWAGGEGGAVVAAAPRAPGRGGALRVHSRVGPSFT